jgi:feruloyl esterase
LKNAQLYPDDFDGWVIGYPVLNITNQTMLGVFSVRAASIGAATLPPDKLPLLSRATLQHCDSRDGVVDGLITDPRACDFEATRDLPLCPGDKDATDCFTRAQAEGIAAIYRGPRNALGQLFFFGSPVGSEIMAPNRGFGPTQGPATLGSLWRVFLLPADPAKPMSSISLAYGDSYVKHFTLQQPGWDWRTGDLSHYEEIARARGLYDLVDALNPDLQRLAASGKKIIHYHGWSDALVTPYVSVDYYERVVARLGDKATHDFYRLYMIPGMGHGPSAGPNDVGDWLQLMQDWVEKGKAPDRVIAKREAIEALGVRAITRPLCPYPQRSTYVGRGSADDAASFRCQAP